MPMPTYRIRCYEPNCPADARYKIAARWSDGLTSELKTYGLTCAEHLPAWFHASHAKQRACHKAKNEILDPPGIFQLGSAKSDSELQRLEDLERRLLGASTPA